MSYFIGIDIGASTVKLGVYDPANGILGERHDYPGKANEGPAATMEVIKAGVDELIREYKLSRDDLYAVGACCPTPVSKEGECLYPTNIDKSWQGVNVKELLSEALSVPAMLLNDGDAAAYREYAVRKAAGRASSGMAQFITGTGLGSALIIEGTVFAGPGVAGELGHIATDSSDTADVCGCGATGCAETRASLIGLANQVRHAQERGGVPSVLQGDPREVSKTLRKLGQLDDPPAAVTAIWREYFTHLGRAVRAAANAVGCDLVVISGGAQEREDGSSDAAYARFLADGIRWIRAELDCSFPHLKKVAVEWSLDKLPDSACYGAAEYVAAQLGYEE